MNGSKSEIDYILINRKWRNSVKNVEAYSSFPSTGSDHRILTAKVKLALRSCKTPPRRKPLDWSALRKDIQLQELYAVTIKNRYDELCRGISDEDSNVTSKYDKLIHANTEAANNLIPTKTRSKSTITSNDPHVIVARDNVNNADPSNVNEQEL